MKKTVVIGASPDKSRYSNLASQMLDNAGFEFVPVGIKKGEILGKQILNIKEMPVVKDVHTVTIYLSPRNQEEWYNYIIGLNPKRIIFNPGTENREFMDLASSNGIEPIEACSLVMLSAGMY